VFVEVGFEEGRKEPNMFAVDSPNGGLTITNEKKGQQIWVK
jgi:hypothetical protein